MDDVTLDPQYRGFWRQAFDDKTAEGRALLQKAINSDSTRYNIGDFNRSTNMPTFPLSVLDKGNLALFSFSKYGEEKIGAVQTWKVHFTDRSRNVLEMSTAIGPKDRYSMSGTLWIEPSTGRVFRAQVELSNRMRKNIEIDMEVRFRLDPAVGLVVPVYMEEHYTDKAAHHELEARADYVNFRRFNSSVKLDSARESHPASGSDTAR